MPEVLTRFPIHDNLAARVTCKIDQANPGLTLGRVQACQKEENR
jgi:hypothetical protein